MGFGARQTRRDAAASGAGEDEETKANRFRALALPHLNDVYTLARYLLPRADAEDAVQECFLRAFRYFGSFGGGPVKPWLLAILRNVARSQRAGAASLVFGEELSVGGAAQELPPLWGEAPESPETSLIKREDAVRLRQLIAGLPAEFREVLVLRELNDLSYREIAQVTGAPEGTVMSRLARARKMLREALEAQEEKA
ncbi:MAG: sigma-70 family RNA polymerase sigma factor [Methylocapsa sp.]|nr:sigma-70 family RNA polymerase sigma factor [Methylocapsa sp.]